MKPIIATRRQPELCEDFRAYRPGNTIRVHLKKGGEKRCWKGRGEADRISWGLAERYRLIGERRLANC